MNHLDVDSHTPEGIVPFRAVFEGETVAFYDQRYDLSSYGAQFTGGRYYTRTLLESADRHSEVGLQLHGGVPSWYVDSKAFGVVKAWLEGWAD